MEAEARRGIELNGPALVQRQIGKAAYWSGGGDQAERTAVRPRAPRSQPSVYLLPAFDEYIVGYRDRSDILDPVHAKALNGGGECSSRCW